MSLKDITARVESRPDLYIDSDALAKRLKITNNNLRQKVWYGSVPKPHGAVVVGKGRRAVWLKSQVRP